MSWVLAHFVGDYLLQDDRMAERKKTSDLWCSIHVLLYMVPFLFCGLQPWQMVAIAAQHYAVDRSGFVVWFMKVKGQERFAKGPCAPWSVILTDNLLHILWIAFVVWLPEAMWSYGFWSSGELPL